MDCSWLKDGKGQNDKANLDLAKDQQSRPASLAETLNNDIRISQIERIWHGRHERTKLIIKQAKVNTYLSRPE